MFSEQRPVVLVFDSGVGGLSVYQEIRRSLPDAGYLYCFDNAGFPYGKKTESCIIERTVSMISTVCQRYPVSLIVIACNTASTVTLPALRETFTVPVIGVVPAIKPAAAMTRNGVIGLLATEATIQRPYTHTLIQRFAAHCQVELLGSPELVEMAEAKLMGKSVSLTALREALDPWFRMESWPDTVVLGCTHFPLLAEELSSVLPDTVTLIDSGQAIARRVKWLLENENLPFFEVTGNRSFCTQQNSKTAQLAPALLRYGLPEPEEVTILQGDHAC